MAQYASRASVNLHTHLFFRNKKTSEDGYILFIRQNALQVLIPKYGLEGTLFIRNETFVFDEDEPSQRCGPVKLTLFQKVKVQLSLDTSNVQHEKLELQLIEPFIPGFSVDLEGGKGDEKMDCEEKSPPKRPKMDTTVNQSEAEKKVKKTKWKKM